MHVWAAIGHFTVREFDLDIIRGGDILHVGTPGSHDSMMMLLSDYTLNGNHGLQVMHNLEDPLFGTCKGISDIVGIDNKINQPEILKGNWN